MPPRLAPLHDHARMFVLDGDWTRLLAAGDVYKNGSYPEYLPDEDMALRIFHLCARCPDGDVAGLGQARYVETRVDPVAREDRRGAPLPRDPGDILCADAEERLRRVPFGDFATPVASRMVVPRRAPLRTRDTPRNAAQAWPEPEYTAFVSVPPAGTEVEVIAPNNHHLLDSQNSHDHGVTSSIRKQISELRGDGPLPGADHCEDAIERLVDGVLVSECSGDEKSNALQVIENLGHYGHSSYGVSERELAALAADKIRGLEPEMRTNVMETLAKQLATGVEHNKVVCSSGKIARIMSAFDGTGVLQETVKPVWAVRQELAELAARSRDRHGGSAREEFVRQARAEYVERLGMSESILEPIIEEYSEHL